MKNATVQMHNAIAEHVAVVMLVLDKVVRAVVHAANSKKGASGSLF